MECKQRDAAGDKLEMLHAVLVKKINESAPSINVWSAARGENKFKDSYTLHFSGDAEELDKVQWSIIAKQLKEKGCDQFYVSQGIYDDGNGVWAGFDLTGQPDEVVLALERGEIEPPYRRRYMEIVVWV